MTPPPTAGPLHGTRGIVLTQAWAGNWCTALLGMMGADVIQVEFRGRLDSWRGDYSAPIMAGIRELPAAEHAWNCNPLYNSVSLNKRCITLDLGTAEGVDIFRRLAVYADFVAENFSPRVLGNLGIDYEALAKIKPDIIVASLSAYGHDGPWANVPGIGGTIEPTAGQSALLGYADGPPLNSGQMYPDPIAGLYGVLGIVSALHHRERTGHGQYIDLSMQESNLSVIGDAALEFTTNGTQRPRLANRHTTFAPHGVFATLGTERWLALACETETQWRALCEVAHHAEWPIDPRFATNAARKANEDALEAVIAAWTAEADRDDLAARLIAAGVLAAPVLDSLEVAQDAHLRARNVVREIDHPEVGRRLQAALPMHFSRTPADIVRHAPLQGQHTYEVLEELLGMGAAEVDELVRLGVSGKGPPDGVDVGAV